MMSKRLGEFIVHHSEVIGGKGLGHKPRPTELNTMKIKVVLEPSDEGGYTVHVPSLPGCISEGETVKEALENIHEAIELYLEPVEGDFITSEHSVVQEIEFVSKVPNVPYDRIVRALQRDGGCRYDKREATCGYKRGWRMNSSSSRFRPTAR